MSEADTYSTEHSSSRQKNYLWLVVVAAILAFVIVGTYLFYTTRSTDLIPRFEITSYEDCVVAIDSQLSGAQRETCVTADGQRFTQPSVARTNTADQRSKFLGFACPDAWIEEFVVDEQRSRETGESYTKFVGAYMVFNGEKRAVSDLNVERIQEQCGTSPQTKLPDGI